MKYFLLWIVISTSSLSVMAQRTYPKEDDVSKYFLTQKLKKKFCFNKEKYKRATVINFAKTGIDTTVVYISSVFNPGTNTIQYTFSRYFSTGEVFSSEYYNSMPTEEQCNDFTYGGWFLIRIKDDGKILSESYTRFLRTWVYSWLRVEEDSIVTYKERYTRFPWGATDRVNHIEKKYKVKLYAKKVDW